MSNFIEYLKNITSLSGTKYLIMFLTVLIFLLIFYAVYSFITTMVKEQVIAKQLETLYKITEQNAKERQEEYEKQTMLEGVVDKGSRLTRLDRMIEHSGLKNKIQFLNAETFIIGFIVIAALTFLIVEELTNVMFYGIASVIILGVFAFSTIAFLAGHNKKKIEESIVNFINLVENYSKTSDDIINIFGKVYPYLEEPLKSDVYACYVEGSQTGNIERAMNNLSKKVNHKKFKDIIRNLSICSRYEANYSDVAEDSRDMIIEYLAGKREREEMVRNARIELLIIIAMCAFMIYLMGSFVGGNIIDILTSTAIGNAILIYMLCSVLGTIVNIALLGNDKD